MFKKSENEVTIQNPEDLTEEEKHYCAGNKLYWTAQSLYLQVAFHLPWSTASVMSRGTVGCNMILKKDAESKIEQVEIGKKFYKCSLSKRELLLLIWKYVREAAPSLRLGFPRLRYTNFL